MEASDVGCNVLMGRAHGIYREGTVGEGFFPEGEGVSNDHDYIREQVHLTISIHIENFLLVQRVDVVCNV